MPGTWAISSTLGRPELLQRAEVLDQGLAAHFTETGYVVEHALDHRLRPPRPVVGDREAVGLVADPLEEVEPLGGAGEDHRVLLVGQPDLLEPLGQAADRDVDDAELAHRRLGGGDLGRPAVDDDEPGRVGELARAAGLGVDQHRSGPVATSVEPGACSSSSRRKRRVITSCIEATSFCPSTPLITNRRYSLLRAGRPRRPPCWRPPRCPGGWRCRSTRCAAAPRPGRAPAGSPRAPGCGR